MSKSHVSMTTTCDARSHSSFCIQRHQWVGSFHRSGSHVPVVPQCTGQSDCHVTTDTVLQVFTTAYCQLDTPTLSLSLSHGVSGSNHNIALSSSCETDRFLFTRCRWTSLHFHHRWDCYVGAKSWLFLEPLLSQFAVTVPMQWYMTRVLFGYPYFGDIFIKERDQKL